MLYPFDLSGVSNDDLYRK